MKSVLQIIVAVYLGLNLVLFIFAMQDSFIVGRCFRSGGCHFRSKIDYFFPGETLGYMAALNQLGGSGE